jgi:hypothetical protein
MIKKIKYKAVFNNCVLNKRVVSFSAFLLVCLFVLTFGLFSCSSSENIQNKNKQNGSSSYHKPSIFLEYSEGGGFDIYEQGDTYGHKIEIDFSGNYTLYKNIYIDTTETPGLKAVEINRGSFSQDTLAKLKETLKSHSFFEYPSYLPEAGPNANLRTPAKHIIITARLSPDEDRKTVRVQLGADHEFYPVNFFDLRSRLRGLLNRAK